MTRYDLTDHLPEEEGVAVTTAVEAVARALAPAAWEALSDAGNLAQKNRRTASLRHAESAITAHAAYLSAVTKATPAEFRAALPPQAALDFLDAQANKWAKEVNLSAMAAAISNKPDRADRIIALARQSFVEGAYRAACEIAAAAASPTKECET